MMSITGSEQKPKITLLDKNVAELIAAGEVVDRPASLVKELVENSIDAGSNSVTVEIMKGGISFIRVSDNGCGISFDEIPTAFLRHATSKVLTEADLEAIATMGFRGEALASIAAVARVEMMSKTKSSPMGSSYKIEGGIEKSHVETGCPDGTTIIIRDLFYNTPARLKFLKKDVSEGNAVQAVIEKLAIIYPEISFRFIRDNKPVRITGGDGKMYTAIYSIFGKQFAASLIPVDYTQNGIRISGYVSSPNFGRGNRTMQYFYVNRRYIKSSSCVAAVEEGSRGSLMVGKFPACVINIEMDFGNVDVNVHPAKTEVRFSDESKIFDTLYFAVKSAILNSDNIKEVIISEKPVPSYEENLPETEGVTNISFSTPLKTMQKSPLIYVPSPSNYERRAEFEDVLTEESTPSPQEQISSKNTTTEPVTMNIQTRHESVNKADDNYKFISNISFVKNKGEQLSIVHPKDNQEITVIGELFKTYILCQKKDEFIIIDKHAAHERIKFEKLKKELQTSSQLLAESILLNFDSAYLDALNEAKDALLDIGFDIIIADSAAEIAAMPSMLEGENIEAIVEELAELFINKGSDPSVIFDDILHTIACKAAIKANDKNDISDLSMLAKAVLENNTIRFCPHGRPVVLNLKKYEIEKMFGRI